MCAEEWCRAEAESGGGVCSPASHFSESEKSEGEERECTDGRTDMPERGVFAGLCNCAGLIGAERKTISLSRFLGAEVKKGDGKRLEREREPERNSGWVKKNKQRVESGIPYKVCAGAR